MHSATNFSTTKCTTNDSTIVSSRNKAIKAGQHTFSRFVMPVSKRHRKIVMIFCAILACCASPRRAKWNKSCGSGYIFAILPLASRSWQNSCALGFMVFAFLGNLHCCAIRRGSNCTDERMRLARTFLRRQQASTFSIFSHEHFYHFR